ncbi:hypothetical protein TWF225_010818 [Orbilia oligospora]|nr:hypothetical protein TWF225_010818 [Orbilia oligospora]KAF3252476.1 hypothetical protein TWF217_007678 [Orbilia oligospora]KAF3271403.1 hypothetical protein TWF128_000008 [Orbilia oligospora]KAF3292604.1 hypothetical protein TWF132_005324 [Orbilia oligospora]
MQCIASFTELYLARSNSNPTSKKAYSVLQLIQVPNPTCFRPNINFVIARAQCSKRGMASGRISAIFPRKPKRPSELFEYRRLKNEPPARWHKRLEGTPMLCGGDVGCQHCKRESLFIKHIWRKGLSRSPTVRT